MLKQKTWALKFQMYMAIEVILGSLVEGPYFIRKRVGARK